MSHKQYNSNSPSVGTDDLGTKMVTSKRTFPIYRTSEN